jgi:hypothetical protein
MCALFGRFSAAADFASRTKGSIRSRCDASSAGRIFNATFRSSSYLAPDTLRPFRLRQALRGFRSGQVLFRFQRPLFKTTRGAWLPILPVFGSVGEFCNHQACIASQFARHREFKAPRLQALALSKGLPRLQLLITRLVMMREFEIAQGNSFIEVFLNERADETE